MAAGLPGTTSDTNTPLRWAATRSPTCRYLSVIVMKEGQISLNIDLAVAILAEHHPPGQPGVNHGQGVAVGDQVLGHILLN